MASGMRGKEKRSWWRRLGGSSAQNHRTKTAKVRDLSGVDRSQRSALWLVWIQGVRTRVMARTVRLIGWIMGVAAVGAALYGLFHFVFKSSHFLIREIRWNTAAEGALVQEWAEASAVRVGDHLFQIRTTDVAKRVASQPWVKHVRVRRMLPGRLEIDVQVRTAVMVLDVGERYLIDEDGVPFKRQDNGEGERLPVLLGMTRADYVGSPEQSIKRFQLAVDLLRRYNTVPSRPAVRSLRFFEVKPGQLADVVLSTDTLTEVWLAWDYQWDRLEASLARFDTARFLLRRRRIEADGIWFNHRADLERMTYRTKKTDVE